MKDRFTLFINSCDSFSDCWPPLFKLLDRFWPDRTCEVVLNTEKRCFVSGGKNYGTMSAKDSNSRLTWSESVEKGLRHVRTPLMLYVQEDYFLNAPVLVHELQRVADLVDRGNISLVEMTNFGSGGMNTASDYTGLSVVDSASRYRVSLQAGLWVVSSFRNLLRAHENAWQFEIFGSIRSRRDRMKYLSVRAPGHDQTVYPYIKTGIIKGRWYEPAVVRLFKENNIDVDFSARGMYRENSRILERWDTCRKLLSRPSLLMKSLR